MKYFFHIHCIIMIPVTSIICLQEVVLNGKNEYSELEKFFIYG